MSFWHPNDATFDVWRHCFYLFTETVWTNPQYAVEVIDPDEDDDDNTGTLIIALMQKERRKKRQEGLELLTIGYLIYKVLRQQGNHQSCLLSKKHRAWSLGETDVLSLFCLQRVLVLTMIDAVVFFSEDLVWRLLRRPLKHMYYWISVLALEKLKHSFIFVTSSLISHFAQRRLICDECRMFGDPDIFRYNRTTRHQLLPLQPVGQSVDVHEHAWDSRPP